MVLLSSSWLQTPCVHAACLPPAPHPEDTQPLQEERSKRLHVAVVSALPTCSHVPDPGFSHQHPSAGRTVSEIPRPLCITDVTAGTPERPVMVEKTHYTLHSNMLLLVFPLGAFDEKIAALCILIACDSTGLLAPFQVRREWPAGDS